MSGHSKWDTIKHKKAINDAKKGKEFSSFPMDRIEKAIEKGVGGADSGIVFEEASYEGFGPGGIQLIVDTISDNKNRTVSELRQVFDQIGGNIGAEGSVSWNFETKGYVVVKSGHMEKAEKFGAEDTFVADDSDGVMMMLMDIPGILDINEIDMDGVKGFEIYTEYNQLAQVRDSIGKLGFVLKEAEIIKEPKIYKKLEGEELEKAQSAIERLEEYEDVQNVWTDLDY